MNNIDRRKFLKGLGAALLVPGLFLKSKITRASLPKPLLIGADDAEADLERELNGAFDRAMAEAWDDADVVEGNGGLITITRDPLNPDLEAFLWEILKKIQRRAAQPASEFFPGMGI